MENKVDLATYNNDWYQPGNPLKRFFWYFFNLCFLINRFQPFGGIRRFVLRLFGAKIGKGVVIKPGVNIKYPWKLKVGNFSWIGEGVWIDNLGEVEIGDNCCISQGALLLCGNHDYKKTTFDLMVGDIKLENGVWIGAKSIVTGGVFCKSHAILTTGSIASQDLDSYGIYRGNPAEKVKDRKIEE